MGAEANSRVRIRGWRLMCGKLGRRIACLVLLALLAAITYAEAALPIQHWQTSTGARVYFVENHDLPMLDVSVDFPAGSARDTPASSGLAGLTLRTMRMGVDGLSEDDVSRRLADVGAVLGNNFDVDRAGYTLRTLSSKAECDQALGMLASVLQSPAFPDAVVQREKARVIAGLQEADVKPEVIAARHFAHLVFGSHPYSLRGTGEVDTVARLTREDLLRFYDRHYSGSAAVVAMIGDVTRERAAQIAEQLTAQLPRAAQPLAPLPPVPTLPAAVLDEVAHPAAQAHILIGAPGMRRLDPDYFPLFVGNYILGGGGFNSRLTAEVREKRGLTYSVYSAFAPYQQDGPFTVGLQTRKDQAQEALAVTRKTLADFVRDGPTQTELAGAKQNLIGGFALRVDSNKKILDYLAVIGFYGLPLDWLEQFPERVAAVGAEQIHDAFRRRVHPEEVVTVVVGGPGEAAPSSQPAGAADTPAR